MSIQAITWAYAQTAPSSGAKFLLVTLANYADEHGTSWPGIERLVGDMDANRKSIIKWARDLETAGLLTVLRRGGDGIGRKPNVYHLHIGEQSPKKSTEPIAKSQKRYIGQSPKNGTSKVPKTTSKVPKTVPDPKEDPSEEPSEKNAPISSARTTQVGARRLQPDWRPGDKAREWIEQHGLTVDRAEPAITEFRAYWLQRSTRRKDWDAAFMRNGTVQAALLRIAKNETHQRNFETATERNARINAELDARARRHLHCVG